MFSFKVSTYPSNKMLHYILVSLYWDVILKASNVPVIQSSLQMAWNRGLTWICVSLLWRTISFAYLLPMTDWRVIHQIKICLYNCVVKILMQIQLPVSKYLIGTLVLVFWTIKYTIKKIKITYLKLTTTMTKSAIIKRTIVVITKVDI